MSGPSSFVVRRLVPGDEDVFRAARLAALADAPDAFERTLAEELVLPPDAWTGRLARAANFALEHDGALRGLCACVPDDEREGSAFLMAMWVAPELRGTGAADALVHAALAQARAEGRRALRLHVGADNLRARRCYERCGFRLTGDGFVRARDGERELEMACPLDAPAPSGDLSGVRAGYDRWAAVYDHDGNPLVALEQPVVEAALGDVSGRTLLDLGCGTGRWALRLAARGAHVTALDFSPGMLAAARAKSGAHAVRFVEHDLRRPLPFADASFERVVSGLVLEHVHDLSAFFAEIARVLVPGGRAVVSGMHPACFLRGTWAHFDDPTSGETVHPGSVAHSIGDFVMAALRAGLRLDDVIERAPDEAFAREVPRAAKSVGFPLLVVLVLCKQDPPAE